MTAPNIINVTSILGKTVFDADISVSDDALLTNAVDSGKVLKVNSLIIANIDGTTSATITVTIKNVAGTVQGYLAYTVSVPADSTLVVISKDTGIYLEEDRVLHVDAGVAGDLSAVCSYEEIDDA